jgi:hypothetical protein
MPSTQIRGTQIADGTITADDLAPGTITELGIADNSITSTKIQDGTVAAADLAPNSVNSSKIEDGSVELADLSNPYNTITVWKDLVADIVTKGGGPTDPSWTKIGSSPFYGYAFRVGDECWLNYHINHDYKPGGQILLHAHWFADGSDINSVKWEFQYALAKGHNQQNFPFAITPFRTGLVNMEQSPPGTPFRHMVAEISSSISVIDAEPDCIIMVHLRRVTNGATNNANNIFVLTADCHYEANYVGTKNKAPNFYL